MVGLGLSGRSGWLRAAAAAIACASVLVLSACDLRLESDPTSFPSPDATTVARNSLADAEAAVLAAATDAGASAEAVAAGAAATARAHIEALGGVYVAYPGATPSPSPSAEPGPNLARAIEAVRTTAADVAATTKDANLAFLARSIDLDWALRELWAARSAAAHAAAADRVAAADATQSSGSPTPDLSASGPAPAALPGDSGDTFFPLADGTTSDGAGFAPQGATGIGVEKLSALALAEDEARFAYETIAALEFDALQDQVLARSRLHAARSDALTSLIASDPRTPLYQLRDANLAEPGSREALERSIEIDLGARYAALLDGASAADAAWLLNAAFDSYARAMATAGFTTAELPTLPGLHVGA